MKPILLITLMMACGGAMGQCVTKSPCTEVRPEWGEMALPTRTELLAHSKADLVQRIFELRKALKEEVDKAGQEYARCHAKDDSKSDCGMSYGGRDYPCKSK